MKKNIAITIRSFGSDPRVMDILKSRFSITYCNTTGSRLTQDELCKALDGAWGVIAGTESFDHTVLSAAKHLQIISRVGVGTDSIDQAAASAKGIKVCTTPSAAVQPVAEHTLALILGITKKIAEYSESTKKGDYRVKSASLLQKRVVGIIGLGKIGFRVGELLSCFGCVIIFFDPFCRNTPHPGWTKADNINEVFSRADIITLHAPAQKNNEPIMNTEAFNLCRNGVILINTARGSLVDETALSEALRSGKVAGAGLDVTVKEPYTGILTAYPQVIITPHVASNTIESRSAMEIEAAGNLIREIRE